MRHLLFVLLLAVPLLESCERDAHAAPPLELAQEVAEQTATLRSGQVIDVRGRPITATEQDDFEQSVGTGNPVSLMGNSAAGGGAEASFSALVVQNFRVVNYHASQAVCLYTVARGAAATTCNSACSAATTKTCEAGGGVTTSGSILTSSMPPFNTAVLGTDCECAKANGAGTTIQTTRVTRAPLEN